MQEVAHFLLEIAREGPQVVLYVAFLGLLAWCAIQMRRITESIDASTIALLSTQSLLMAHDLTTVGVEKGISEDACRQALIKYEEVRKQNEQLIAALASRRGSRRAG